MWTSSPFFASIITVVLVVAIGALKTAGIIDADTMDLALVAGGFGVGGFAVGHSTSHRNPPPSEDE